MLDVVSIEVSRQRPDGKLQHGAREHLWGLKFPREVRKLRLHVVLLRPPVALDDADDVAVRVALDEFFDRHRRSLRTGARGATIRTTAVSAVSTTVATVCACPIVSSPSVDATRPAARWPCRSSRSSSVSRAG